MRAKRKFGRHFKTCRKCRKNFYGNKYSKVCLECDPRKNPSKYSEEQMKEIIRKKLENFEDLI